MQMRLAVVLKRPLVVVSTCLFVCTIISFQRWGAHVRIISTNVEILKLPINWNATRLEQQATRLERSMKHYDVDCVKLIQGNRLEIQRVRALEVVNEFEQTDTEVIREEHELLKLTRNCDKFIDKRQYVTMEKVSDSELDFPLAFSVLLFKNVLQFERLFRSIYRPHNFYCIHVDKKSSNLTHAVIRGVVRCLDNVFVSPILYDVKWGSFSVIQPELTCMEELLKRSKTWRYFINLTGQEFPLKTNWEIVQILSIFNGSNNLEGTVKRRNRDRTVGVPPPGNVTLVKGSVHITASRAFVDYMINNDTAKQFLRWVQHTRIPDETFFASLNHSPHLKVPGSYLGIPETDTKRNLFITRFKNWGNGPFNWPCKGKRTRGVCIFGIGDLPLLASRPELFANKFYSEYEPATYDCMEELIYNRTISEFLGNPSPINKTFYSNLDFVKHHI